MGLEDIIIKDARELPKQPENNLEKNNDSINKSDSGISDNGISQIDNSHNDSNLENNSLSTVDTTDKESNQRSEDNEQNVSRQNSKASASGASKDSRKNVSDEDSEGSVSSYDSSGVANDSDLASDIDIADKYSTDSELYVKNIEEEEPIIEETDEECTSISDQESVQTDDDFVYEDIISPIENQDEKSADEDSLKSDVELIAEDQGSCSKIDKDGYTPDVKYSTDTTASYNNKIDDADISSFLEDEIVIFEFEGLKSVKAIEDYVFAEGCSIDVEFRNLDEEYYSTTELGFNTKVSQKRNVETKKDQIFMDEDQTIEDKIDKDEYISSFQGYKIDMGVLISEDVDMIDKLIDICEITDMELDEVDKDEIKNKVNDAPVFSELEVVIMTKFSQTDYELEYLAQEALQNQEYEFEV